MSVVVLLSLLLKINGYGNTDADVCFCLKEFVQVVLKRILVSVFFLNQIFLHSL